MDRNTKGATRYRVPKRSKEIGKDLQPITQEDFYIQATDFEEQAERWMLSDVRKTIRNYYLAYESYEKGLSASEANPGCAYNILYNETRLFLLLYTDYVAINGNINVLQYVRMDDMEYIKPLLLELPEIISKFETVYENFPVQRTWDLEFNLLVCYLELIDSAEKYSLTGEQILKLSNKFINLTGDVITNQINELQEWDNIMRKNQEEQEDNLAGFYKDTLDTEQANNGLDGSGIRTNANSNNGANNVEMSNVSDQVTPYSLADTFSFGYKFIASIMELTIEVRCSEKTSGITDLNIIQANFLDDLIYKFKLQLEDIIQSSQKLLKDNTIDIEIVRQACEGLTFFGSGDLKSLENYCENTNQFEANSNALDKSKYIELLLSKIDVMNFANSCAEGVETSDIQWKLLTLNNKLLVETRNQLTILRNQISSNKTSNQNDKLSSTVFQLCDIYITNSENEQKRIALKQKELAEKQLNGDDTSGTIKTITILNKNARTLLTNAAKIAEQPCGLEEYITDKLKRNYIYLQARSKLTEMEQQ